MVKFKRVQMPIKNGKVQNRLYWSYDGIDWFWIGKCKPMLQSSKSLRDALPDVPYTIIG